MSPIANTSDARPNVQAEVVKPAPAPRRWSLRPTQPRLVSFGWAAVTPRPTQR